MAYAAISWTTPTPMLHVVLPSPLLLSYLALTMVWGRFCVTESIKLLTLAQRVRTPVVPPNLIACFLPLEEWATCGAYHS